MEWKNRPADYLEPDNLDEAAEFALREGLRAQPMPTVSAGFDERVMRAVRGRSPFWEPLMSAFRPALATAAVATVVTTLLISPKWASPDPAIAASAPPTSRREALAASVERRAVREGAYIVAQPLRDAASIAAKPHKPGAPHG